jgi:hypothetical protein
MGFFELHEKWLQTHRSKRKGERLGRLNRGYSHGEDRMVQHILYPIFGSLDELHPEYEVAELNGKTIYVDVAFIRGNLKVAFELDGFASHAKDVSRENFCWDRRRDLMLSADGWVVIHIAYDDLQERTSLIARLIRKRLASCLNQHESYRQFSVWEREIVRLGMTKTATDWFRLHEVTDQLGVCTDTARDVLRKLVNENVLLVGGNVEKRVHRYKLNHAHAKVRRWVSGV